VNPHDITAEFERNLCEYTGAKHAVAVTSCTMALLLACAWFKRNYESRYEITLPKRTYVGVPMSVIHAGFRVRFIDLNWQGEYKLSPLPVWDAARRFTSGMYRLGTMQCLSFHVSKILGDTQGGAILLDDPVAYEWLKRARFDGRTEGVAPAEDHFDFCGWHCYLSPSVAAQLLWKLSFMPKHNADLPRSDYPDLSQHMAFQ
jgi:dTDP-4-amino-4,6-dideoxygalactose transaminase